ETGEQLLRYMNTLCSYLLAEGNLKKVNILGAVLELLPHPPSSGQPRYQQRAILLCNEVGILDASFSEPLLPLEYFLPTSVILILQHMLYTLSDAEIAHLLMAISAMNTYYSIRHSYRELEARRMAPLHAWKQVENNLV
ncbi:MAG: hypothetical protein FWF06_07970, partial [Symbiobacteriaceae bacterium]|nr:hypothetical protein [Symbiobacteriaceae bacterium]